MKPKVTIIDGNNEIELSTIEENIKAFMVKGEPGTDGFSPTVTATKQNKVTTLTITDKNGTRVTSINDGFSPLVDVSKSNRVTTISITDEEGTETATISDGIDLTGGVPTNGVIGFDGTASEIPNGYEVSTDGIATQTDLATKQDTLVSGTNIKTVNNTSLLGSGNVTISGANAQNTYNASTTDPYSCNYVNNNFESKSKLLWTNPNPTSAFSAQTVTLSSSDYDVLEIFYFDFTGTLNIYSTKTLKGSPCNLMALFQYQDHGYAGSRLATYVSDTSYNFQTPITVIESDAFGRHTAAQWCVPLYIVGYKTGLFS